MFNVLDIISKKKLILTPQKDSIDISKTFKTLKCSIILGPLLPTPETKTS